MLIRYLCQDKLDLSNFINEGPDDINSAISGGKSINYEFFTKKYLIDINIFSSEDSALYHVEVFIYEDNTPTWRNSIHPHTNIKFQEFQFAKMIFNPGSSRGFFNAETTADIIIKICEVVTAAYKVEGLIAFL